MSAVASCISSNPVLAGALYLALGTIFSWLASKAEALPRVHAVLSILGIVTIPVQALAAAVWRLVTGAPPPPTSLVMSKRTPKPTLPLACLALLVVLFALVMTGCIAAKSPAQQVADVATLEDCITTHWGQPVVAVAQACTSSEVAAAEDAIADAEALFESRVSATDAGTTAALASFPYSDNFEILSKVNVRLAQIAQTRALVVGDAGGS